MSGFGFNDPDMADIMENIEKPMPPDREKLDQALSQGLIDIEMTTTTRAVIALDKDPPEYLPVKLEKTDGKVNQQDVNMIMSWDHDERKKATKKYVLANEDLWHAVNSFLASLEIEEVEDYEPREVLGSLTQQQANSPTRTEYIDAYRSMRGGVDRRFGDVGYRAGGYNM